MALYLKLNPQITLASDSGYKQKFWDRTDAGLNVILRTDLTEQSSGVLRINPAASVAVPFGSVATAALVHLECDQQCGVVLNGGAESVTIQGSGSYPGMLTLHGTCTGAVVTNNGTSVAEVAYLVVGA